MKTKPVVNGSEKKLAVEGSDYIMKEIMKAAEKDPKFKEIVDIQIDRVEQLKIRDKGFAAASFIKETYDSVIKNTKIPEEFKDFMDSAQKSAKLLRKFQNNQRNYDKAHSTDEKKIEYYETEQGHFELAHCAHYFEQMKEGQKKISSRLTNDVAKVVREEGPEVGAKKAEAVIEKVVIPALRLGSEAIHEVTQKGKVVAGPAKDLKEGVKSVGKKIKKEASGIGKNLQKKLSGTKNKAVDKMSKIAEKLKGGRSV